MNVQFVVDSASDLPKSYYNDFSLEKIPLIVILEEKEYLDGETIEPKTVYDAMREGKSAKTAQGTPESFYQVFKKHAEKNVPIIYLGFSSELSGTYQSSLIAKQQVLEEFPDAEIHTIDTKAASMGYGMIVYNVVKYAQENEASVQDLLDLSQFYINHQEHIFTVDDLEYLQRGGRVSKTQAFVGGLLNIKPLLHVEEGKLVPLEKIRGSNKVLKRMVEVMKERGNNLDEQTIAITHSDSIETAEKLKELIISEGINPKEIIISDIGAVIGAHVGPGTIALFFLNKTK